MKSLITTIFVLALAAPTAQGQSYHLTDLGTLSGGFESGAYGINVGGTIVGDSNAIDHSYGHAFLYDGAMHDLGTSNVNESFAYGINASGKVVGEATTMGISRPHAYFYDGAIHDLGTLGGTGSAASGINGSGQIVGSSDTAPNDITHAFLYDGAMHDLGTLGGTFSTANAINDGGKIVGQSTLAGDGIFRAFLYDGLMHDLGTLGGTSSSAFDINANGKIVGYSEIGSSSHAFLYDGAMHDLGTLGGFSAARAINGSGQIVGDSDITNGSFVRHAFLYSNGVLADLNTLLDASGTEWTLQFAHDINDSGWIVGQGEKSDGSLHAYLLTPVPEPSTFVLAALGLVGLWLLTRRKRVLELIMGHDQIRTCQPLVFKKSRLFRITLMIIALFLSAPIYNSADAQSFLPLGGLSQPPSGRIESNADAVSANGAIVVGDSLIYSPFRTEAFRWTPTTSMVAVDPTAFSVGSSAHGLSGDGSVVVGSAYFLHGVEVRYSAYRWTQATGMVDLGYLPVAGNPNHPDTTAFGISDNGSVVVGNSGAKAFRWSQATGIVDLGHLPGDTSSTALAISANGSVVVGDSASSATGKTRAFKWTQAGGMIDLGHLLGGEGSTFASATSADGSVIVGYSNGANGGEAFRWTQATGMVGLGFLLDGDGVNGPSVATAISADGSVIVGSTKSLTRHDQKTAFIWDVVHGMRDLEDLLSDSGLAPNLADWDLLNATGISADGQTIVGQGLVNSGPNYEAWIASVPEPSAILMAVLGFVGLFGQRLLNGSHFAA